MSSKTSFKHRSAIAALIFCLALGGCASKEEKAERAATRSNEAYGVGDYQGAKAAALEAVSQRDDVARYWMALGQVEMKLGDYAGAYDAYSHASELEPNNIDALHYVAEIAQAAKRLDDATKQANKILKIDPRDIRAQMVLGYVALRQHHYPDALRWADKILGYYPLEEAPLILKARALNELGQRAEAIALIERVIPVRGASPTKLDTLLEFYRGGGDLAGVERTLLRYITLQPDNIGIKLQYAAQLYRDGKAPGAENLLVPMLRAGVVPDQIADVMINLGGNSPSQALIEQLGSDAPAPVVEAVARIALEKGYPDLAMHLVAPYVGGKVTPTVATAAGLFADAKLATGRTDEAMAVAQRVLTFDKTSSRALRVRSEVSLSRGDLNQALTDARVLVRDSPDAQENRTLLARIYEARGDGQLAETTLRDAYNDFPGNSAVLNQYLNLLTRQKKVALAADVARDFTQHFPGEAKGWKALGDLCRTTGDTACVTELAKAQSRLEMAQTQSQTPA